MADELNKTTPTTTTPATGTTGTTGSTATPTVASQAKSAPSQLDQYNQQRESKIRDLYSASRNNAVQGLKTAYDQNMAEQQRAMDKISPQYQESMNQLSAEYERQRRNNNMQAAANGLNTGAGSQMQLGQMNAYTQSQAGLKKQENEALDNANQNMVDMKTNYQNQIAQATANNDYQQAAALLDEYGKQYERQMTQASQLAEYGDFSMYANIYGQGAAQQMERTWALQNPLLAYNLGKLTAQEYFNMTGSNPPGYGGGGGGGYIDGGSGGSGNRSYYTGPAGYYDKPGNFVVPSTGAIYGSKVNDPEAGVPRNSNSSSSSGSSNATTSAREAISNLAAKVNSWMHKG